MIAIPEIPILCPVALGEVRGEISEEIVGAVLTREHMPPWFLHARHATRAEDDIAGFDWAVYTRDVGRILLQVKSSKCGRDNFELHARHLRPHPMFRVHVVIVRPDMPLAEAQRRVIATCDGAREEASAARACADHWSLYPFLREVAA